MTTGPHSYPRVARFRTVDELRGHLAAIDAPIPLADTPRCAAAGSPLAQPLLLGGRTAGNRWCIHPMEGWDASPDGLPTEILLRRWRRFGESGAKLIWGGEAVAVVAEGRANPNQLCAPACRSAGFATLLAAVRDAHRAANGRDDDLVVALQLTHSGRFSKPTPAGRVPRIAFHHPLLDARHGVDPADTACVVSDSDVERLIDAYVAAARDADAAGFDMVDLKACHGYLIHEFLSARRRPGPWGGDFAGRTRLLRTLVERVTAECPRLAIGVRLSLFDTVPWHMVDGHGAPFPHADALPYDCGFGVDERDPLRIDLAEPVALLRLLRDLGVVAVNLSAGSPYTVPHVTRPAAFPPSDGYPPPEDPLAGVWRQIDAAREAKAAVPDLVMVGSGYTYLQDFVVHAAEATVGRGWIDAVGLGRMVLSYPTLPADSLAGRPLTRGAVCRTFSDCTTAPRHGLRSGCYPLDAFYKALPEAAEVKAIKARFDKGG
ncbi:MAG: NADH:flavin oxidoreductase [Planctomycetia bacterium]|nr:NADH:flavin oxidoreductase [Planctomycetia bacterium]